jgi:hypothetical protein
MLYWATFNVECNVIVLAVFYLSVSTIKSQRRCMRLWWHSALILRRTRRLQAILILPLLSHSFINASTAVCWALASSSVSHLFYADGRTPWTSDQPFTRPLPTHRINAYTQTSMPWMGFWPTIPAFERAKAVHALDRAATVIGRLSFVSCWKFYEKCFELFRVSCN